MEYRMTQAWEFADRIVGLGFRVLLAKDGRYGVITDAEGSRVLSFSFNDGGHLGGNYGPPSRESGTGWRLDAGPYDLKTADDVRGALYAQPPQWAGKGWHYLTTLDQHLTTYGASSGYQEHVAQ